MHDEGLSPYEEMEHATRMKNLWVSSHVHRGGSRLVAKTAKAWFFERILCKHLQGFQAITHSQRNTKNWYIACRTAITLVVPIATRQNGSQSEQKCWWQQCSRCKCQDELLRASWNRKTSYRGGVRTTPRTSYIHFLT